MVGRILLSCVVAIAAAGSSGCCRLSRCKPCCDICADCGVPECGCPDAACGCPDAACGCPDAACGCPDAACGCPDAACGCPTDCGTVTCGSGCSSSCNDCPIFGCLGRLFGGCLSGCCGGCSGELYYDEWCNDPPAPCDPCDAYGNHVRGGSRYRAPYRRNVAASNAARGLKAAPPMPVASEEGPVLR